MAIVNIDVIGSEGRVVVVGSCGHCGVFAAQVLEHTPRDDARRSCADKLREQGCHHVTSYGLPPSRRAW